jgi:hypothetical protein
VKLKPEASLTFGVATIVLVYGIYQHALPTLVEHRVGQSGDQDAAAAEKAATWTALATVAGISLIARDATIAIMGGAATIGLSWWHKHANLVSPLTRVATAGAMLDAQPVDMPNFDAPAAQMAPDYDPLPYG